MINILLVVYYLFINQMVIKITYISQQNKIYIFIKNLMFLLNQFINSLIY